MMEEFRMWLDEEIDKLKHIARDNDLFNQGKLSEAIRIRAILNNKDESDNSIFCDKYCKFPVLWDEEAEGVALADSDICEKCPLNKGDK